MGFRIGGDSGPGRKGRPPGETAPARRYATSASSNRDASHQPAAAANYVEVRLFLVDDVDQSRVTWGDGGFGRTRGDDKKRDWLSSICFRNMCDLHTCFGILYTSEYN